MALRIHTNDVRVCVCVRRVVRMSAERSCNLMKTKPTSLNKYELYYATVHSASNSKTSCDDIYLAIRGINNNKLKADHSTECRTHAAEPTHSIAWNMFYTLWRCDLDLWPFNPKIKIITLVRYPKVIPYTKFDPYTKFEHFGIIRFGVIVRADTQTHRQMLMNALLPRLSSAWVQETHQEMRQPNVTIRLFDHPLPV